MQDPKKTSPNGPLDGEVDNANATKEADACELKRTQRELKRVTEELETCKKELRQKEEALLTLGDELKDLSNGHLLHEKEAKLERTTAEMERAQEMATMGSWVLEVETGEVTWTPELHRMFGHDPSSPAPSLEEQKSWYTEKSYNAMLKAVKRTSEYGSPYNIELETIRRDGSNGMVRSIGEAELDKNGRIIRLRGVAQDITEIKQAEAKLKHALKQERAAKIYKDQFLANMSHEIRTPMNGVVGFASLLRDEELNAETRNDYINTIEACSIQLLNLIDDIIDIAKIEAGEIKIEAKLFNLTKLILETANTLKATRSDKGKNHIRLLTHIPEGSETLTIYSDPLRIQQILTNLLNNALKFSNQGTIEFGFELKDDAVQFFVKDQGIGIAPERMKLIYERFEHLEGDSIKYEGTGLGLSISKGLAELLGATMSVESELGVGSVFRLKVPLNAAASTTQDYEHAQPTPEDYSKGNQTCTLLIAEDEETNQKLVQRMLQSTPFKLLLVGDGAQAVQCYQDHPEIDLVLMDIRMPIMNGGAAAKEILKFDSDAKIIAQTAYAMQEDRAQFLKAGFVDYISKPYKANELRDMLRKWTVKS